jgi:hypothetical protein
MIIFPPQNLDSLQRLVITVVGSAGGWSNKFAMLGSEHNLFPLGITRSP